MSNQTVNLTIESLEALTLAIGSGHRDVFRQIPKFEGSKDEDPITFFKEAKRLLEEVPEKGALAYDQH